MRAAQTSLLIARKACACGAAALRRSIAWRPAIVPRTLPKPDYAIIAAKGQSIPDLAPSIAALLAPADIGRSRDQWRSVVVFSSAWYCIVGTGAGVRRSGGCFRARDSAHKVIGCVVHASAWMGEPGVVDVQGEDRLIFGEPDGSTSKRCEMLAHAFAGSTVSPVVSPNVRLAIWTKLWGNMTMNPLSVLTGATTGAMLDDPGVCALVRTMMLEMQALGTRIGLALDLTPEGRMEITRKLGDFKTSMLRDAEAGRGIEIEPILGALVEIADRLAEPTPNLRAVLGLVRVHEAARR